MTYALLYFGVAWVVLVCVWSVDDSGPWWLDLGAAVLWPLLVPLAAAIAVIERRRGHD